MRGYGPQKITLALLRRVARADPPDKPREIRDSSRGLILRHQPSGYMAIYAQLGRGKRERLCNAQHVLLESNPLTLQAVFAKAKVLHGESAGGRNFKAERDASRSVPTFANYLEETYGPWVITERRSGAATLERLNTCFGPSFGTSKLTDITPAKVAAWRSKRRKAGIRAETSNRDVAALRACLSRAVRFRLIPDNPLAGLEQLEVDPHRRVVRAFTATDKAQVLVALDNRDAKKRQQRASANQWREDRGRRTLPPVGKFADVLTPAVIVSLETGLRRNELFSLEWPSIDLDGKTLRVEGKTAKTFQTRTIPLNQVAVRVLRDWWLQSGQPKIGHVFTINGEPVKDLKRSFYGVLNDAGIERVNSRGERLCWHSLRHTFGSSLGAAGVDPVTIQKLMGHANLATSQRYLHSDEDRMREAVEKLSEAS